MDLTSLSSNLPRSLDDLDAGEEPTSTILMSSFKQAALSVTNLYKTAAEQADRARRTGRAEGYNECLEDLLSLLTRLEGRADAATAETIRQWALSRRRKSRAASVTTAATNPEPRDDSMETEIPIEHAAAHSSSSPPPEPTPPPQEPQLVASIPSQIEQPRPILPSPAPTAAVPSMPSFTFQHPAPQDANYKNLDDDEDEADFASPPASPPPNPFQTMQQPRREMRGHGHPRHLHHQPRTTAGQKRRFGSVNDFFDLAGLEKMQMGKKGRFQ